jgi:ABC-2 type transport system permease protein
MSKILTIIQREILVKIKTKAFWITALLIPLGFAVFLGISVLVAFISSSSTGQSQNITILDQANLLKQEDLKYGDSTLSLAPTDSKLEDLKEKNYQSNDILVFVPSQLGQETSAKVQLFSQKPVSVNLDQYIVDALTQKIKQNRLNELGLNKEQINQLNFTTQSENIIQGQNNTEQKSTSGIAYGVSYFISIAIYTISSIFGAMIMMSILEEKSSRVIEVILATVTPMQLLVGKILGQFSLILIQVVTVIIGSIGVLIASVFTLFLFGSQQTLNSIQDNQPPTTGSVPDISFLSGFTGLSDNLGWFILLVLFYFAAGLVMSALNYAAIGAAGESYQTASNSAISWIISIPSLVGFLFLNLVISDPNSVISKALSIFPFTSFMIMPARLMFGVEPLDLVISIVVMLLSICLQFWIVAKIYRVGVLMYGKNASLKELYKWIRQA